ncbi:alpha/beta hydrolase [Roseateles oligotrophus]|uniref:Alpha/beta hydrolase n=1 Tax=Roseateles oligotrophus TaxID=1769250 RepID=A0ABT2YE87_9BURK|nr:alpha/beta hydrolase [Roseateles oligotrophus]MCV2368344.1 alpha/beta hydrolase [Roseateles oligotrophus]
MTWNRTVLIVGLGLLALLIALGAFAPLNALNALASTDSHTRATNIPYGALPRQRLDIYSPDGVMPVGGWPVVVFFYGGSWNSGERAQYGFVGAALASRGILTLVADYRLYPEVRFPDFLTDSAQALAWGLTHAVNHGGNPRRVYVMGHSAGGYNAAMLALDGRWLSATGHSPRELAGFIGLAGPYDFLPMTNLDAQPVFFHPNYPPDTQPMAFASTAAPRSFLAAGSTDSLVNPERNTEALAARLSAAGVPVSLHRYEHATHATLIGAFGLPLRWLAPVLDDVASFVLDSSAR